MQFIQKIKTKWNDTDHMAKRADLSPLGYKTTVFQIRHAIDSNSHSQIMPKQQEAEIRTLFRLKEAGYL